MSVSFDKNNNSFFIYGPEEFNLNFNTEPYEIKPFDNSLIMEHENIKIAILIPNENVSDFIFQYISPQFAKYYDNDSEKFIGRSIQMIYQEMGANICSILKNVYNTKNNDFVYFNYYNGNNLRYSLKLTIQYNDEGYLSVLAEDYTAQIKIRELSSLNQSSSYIQKNKKFAIGTRFENGIHSWSDGIYEILEREPHSDDKTHNIIFDIVIPEEREKLEELKQFLRDNPKKSYEGIFNILTDKNVVKSLKIDIKKIFKEDKLEKTVAILYDVTEELKTQKKYKIINDLNSSINNYFNISGFVVNYENGYYHISDNIVKILHLSKKNPRLMAYDIIHNIFSPEFPILLEKLKNDEIKLIDEIFDYKSDNYNKSQKIHFTYFKKIYDNETYYIGGFQDVTKEFEDQNKILAKNQELNLLQNTLVDAEKSNQLTVPFMDKEHKYHWTEGIYEILERKPLPNDENENILLNACDEKTKINLSNKINNLSRNELLDNQEIKIITHKGNVKYLQINVRNVYDNEGNFIQQSAYCRDITAKHDNEEEIELLTNVMQKINTNLGTGAFIWDENEDLMIITDSAREIAHVEDMGNPKLELQKFKNNLLESEKYQQEVNKLHANEITAINSIWDYKSPSHDTIQKIKINYQKIKTENKELWVAGIKDVTEEIERQNKLIERNNDNELLTTLLSEINKGLGTGAFTVDVENDKYYWDEEILNIIHVEVEHPLKVLKNFRENVQDNGEYKAKLKQLYSGEIDRIFDILDYKSPNYDKVQKIQLLYEGININNHQYWIGGLKDVTEEIERQNEIITANNNMSLMIKESNHRIKNNLNLLLRFISLEKRFNSPPEDILNKILGRINSLIVLHEKLYKSENTKEVNAIETVKQMIHDMHEIYKDISPGINIKFDEYKDFKIPNEKVAPTLLILNELIINTFKYAYKDMDIENKEFYGYVKKEGNICKCFVKDNGKGYPEGFDPKNSKGLGWIIIQSLTKQLNGEFEAYNDNGACFKLDFPIN